MSSSQWALIHSAQAQNLRQNAQQVSSCREHTPQLCTQPSVQVQALMDADSHRGSRGKILIKWRYHNTRHQPCRTTFTCNQVMDLWLCCIAGQALLYVFVGAEVTQVCGAYMLYRCHRCLLLHRAPGHFVPWRPVRKCLFLCCCLAFPWRPIGMRSLVAAVCKNRKQSRQQGVKQIHTTPNSVFSPFISPAFFLPPSLSFILPHTHRIRGLCHVLGKRVLLLLTKARNSSIWPTLLAVPPSPLPLLLLLLPPARPRHSPTSACMAVCCTHCKRPIQLLIWAK